MVEYEQCRQRARKDASPMMMPFHLADLVVLFIMLFLLVSALIAIGWSVGAGYAWMRHRLEQRSQ